MWMFFASVVL